MLKIGDRENFETLKLAFSDDNVALMECTDNEGNYVAVICAVERDFDGTVNMVPFARMFDGNPYDIVNPPIELSSAKESAK